MTAPAIVPVLKVAAEQLLVSRTTVDKLCRQGELTKVHVAGRAFVLQSSIDAYLARIAAASEAALRPMSAE